MNYNDEKAPEPEKRKPLKEFTFTRTLQNGKTATPLGNINNDHTPRKKINGKQIKDPLTNEYVDYDGYEGFNCFPCEKTQKRKNNEIDELNHDLNELLKDKNIMENKLINLQGHSKTINNILKKKELNHKIVETENKINEIRVRLKQLKGL